MMNKLRRLALGAALAGAGYAAGSFRFRDAEPAAEICLVRDDASLHFIDVMARRSLRQSSLQLRHELGAGLEGDLEISYLFSVGAGGKLGLLESGVRCSGASCPRESELPELIGVLLASEWNVNPKEAGCTLLIRAAVPPLWMPEREPIIMMQGDPIEL